MKHRMLLLCIFAVGCASNSQREEDKDLLSATTGDWSATISPRSGSDVRGELKLQSVVVGSAANISITGAAAGAQHPWHVHTGTCSNSGPIVGSVSNYPLLTVGTDGRASANATISTALSEGTSYIVNVHRSTSDLGTIIGCGELKN